MITHPAHIADWGAAQQRSTSFMHPVPVITVEDENPYTSIPLQQQQQQHRNPQEHLEEGQHFAGSPAAALCTANQLLGICSCSTSSDQLQQRLLAGPLSGAGNLLGAIMHSVGAELQREIQHFAGAVVQQHKQTLLKDIQSLSLTAAVPGQAVAVAELSSCNTNAAASTQHDCGYRSGPNADGKAAATAAAAANVGAVQPSNWMLYDAAVLSSAAGDNSSPPLPLTSSGSNEPQLLNQTAAAGNRAAAAVAAAAAAAAAVRATYTCSHQPNGNIGRSSVAPTAAGALAGAKPQAAAAVAGGCAKSSSIAMSPFSRQCQQEAICQLLQAPEQQQQQHVQVLTTSQVQPSQPQQQQQQQQQLPGSPADLSQHSVAAAASDNAAAVHSWQYDQLSDEDMQQLLDAIEPDAAAVAQDEPISENMFAEIDALLNDSAFSDFPKPDAGLGINPGPTIEFALLQLDSLPHQSQQQLGNVQQHFEARQQQQIVMQSHQQPVQQQQQQSRDAPLQINVAAAPFASSAPISIAANNFSPAAVPCFNCMQQLLSPCSHPVWQQQQQQLPLMTAPPAISCRSAASDNVYNSDGCNGKSGKGKGRARGRTAAAAATGKTKSQQQQQQQQQQLKKKRSRKVEAPVPVKRANSDRSCSSGAAAAAAPQRVQCNQAQLQLQQQWSMPVPSMQRQQQRLQLQPQQSWPHNRRQQQQQQPQPVWPQGSVNLAAQLPAWLTRQVAITQSLISGTR